MEDILGILRLRVGDRVVMPPHGLAEVRGVAEAPGADGAPEPLLVLAFASGLRLEIGLEDAVLKLRPPSPRPEAEAALALLRAPRPPADARPEETSPDARLATAAAGQLGGLARLVRLLHALPDPSPGELRFREELEAQVLAELGLALGFPPATLRAELEAVWHPPAPAAPPEPDGPAPAVPCHQHPRKAATDSCAECLRPMCELCATADGARFLCPACARARRRARRALALSLALGLAGLLGGLTAWLVATYEEPFDYGKHELEVKRAAQRLEQEPCDRVKMLHFAEQLLELGDHPRLVARARRFLAECGPFDRLLWVTHEAHKRQGEYPEALADVGQLIERYPRDKDFRWWRAEVHERLRDWPRALEDYRQALALQPRLRTIPFSMARAAREAGRECEGIFALEQVAFHHPEAAEDEELLSALEGLYRAPDCQGMAGSGHAFVEAQEDGALPPVEVGLGDGRRARVLLDLQLGLSLVSPALASRLGLDRPAGQPDLLLWDGREVRTGWLAVLPQVELDGARAGRVEALVAELAGWQDEAGTPLDGVLGLSFLGRFALGEADGGIALGPKIAE
ncbi:MAG TPA: tetratricopeptide repeat protein [Myxococcota bacterium]|nr:tetratricopeptide repeat protein [Myxococcota bacterium]HRY92012.1 tetratricopeptide repeat protein [Myxococcota bacterium]HSA22269.1 tetratricopeptide repeat protein [Myxococcota bacterium]